jgi:hypothetical protein
LIYDLRREIVGLVGGLWRDVVAQAGVVLDHAGNLADQVLSAAIRHTLDSPMKS